MTIAILHLSDIHVRHDKRNPALEWGEAIAAAISPEVVECTKVFVVVTGDLAFSGLADEYTAVWGLFDSLMNALRSRHLVLGDVVVVPGNHDCDFRANDSVRTALLKEAVREPDLKVVTTCNAIQASFKAFASERGLVYPGDQVVATHTQTSGDSTIRFLTCNSAWMSSLKELGGTIRAPMRLIEDDTAASLDGDPSLVVWMMHHPYPWFEPDESRALRRHIESMADVVLTGHEHDGGSYTRSYRSGLQVDYVEGGVLQEHADSGISTFNLVVVDLAQKRQRVITFGRLDDGYVSGATETWFPFVKNRTRKARLFEHNEGFRSYLEDAGAAFTHPRQSPLRLRDLFVYPDVRNLPLAGVKDRGLIGDIPDFIASRRKVMLVGPDKSGKTTIAKRLCMDLLSCDAITLMADGATFHPRGFQRVRDEVRKLIQGQYSQESTDPIMRLPRENRALIVDNYHLVKLTREGRATLLKELAAFFDIIVLLANEDFRVEYLAQSPESAGNHPVFDYSHGELLQLGHVRRHDMIGRWYWLGRDRAEVDEAGVQREILHAENLISGLIGKNLIPSYPIFVLILLQQMEIGRAHDTGAGSHGYLYQSLILASLRKIAQNPHDIDGRFNYLTELAWFLSDGEPTESGTMPRIGQDALSRWHAQYCERQLVALSYPKYVDDLIGAGLLREEAGQVQFAYPYVRYFFIARHLKAHLHEDATRAVVAGYASRLHDEQTATVMVFLAHLSSDPFVLDTMIAEATRLFAEHGEWDTSAQTLYLNSLVQETPKLALLQKSLEQNRVEELEHLDKRERNEEVTDPIEEDDQEQSDAEFEAEIAPLLKMNSAFKTIQIIGQILRNYPGSLHGRRKIQLAEVCYRLGFRVLGFLFGSIEAHGAEFIKTLVAHITRLDPEAEVERITVDANALVFAIFERCAFAVTRHISQSLGHHELAPVFKEIERVGGGKTPFRLIDLSIKLDHFRQPPADEAITLYEDEKANTLVSTVVRHLVWYHLYLFDIDYKVRQRLCRKLKIDNDVRMLAKETKLITKVGSA